MATKNGDDGYFPAPNNTVAADPPVRDDEEDRRRGVVPESVAKRFRQIEDKFYGPDKKLAFIDAGAKLRAESSDIDVVRSLVEIAEARGWDALAVSGSNDFRRQVWREAALRGIDVRGYEPTDLERADTKAAIEKRDGPNVIQQETRSKPEPAKPEQAGQPKGATSEPIAGKLIEVSLEPTPYRFQEGGRLTQYVIIETANGRQTIWGDDIEEAVFYRSQPPVRIGDAVVAATVNDREVGKRNIWVIERAESFEERMIEARAEFAAQERAQAPPAQQQTQPSARKDDAPALLATMRAAELFAEERIEAPEDRRRFLALIRKTLDGMQMRGEPIPMPKIKDPHVAEKEQQQEMVRA